MGPKSPPVTSRTHGKLAVGEREEREKERGRRPKWSTTFFVGGRTSQSDSPFPFCSSVGSSRLRLREGKSNRKAGGGCTHG